jgi:tetratricopeptide (TPR) repeat protein
MFDWCFKKVLETGGRGPEGKRSSVSAVDRGCPGTCQKPASFSGAGLWGAVAIMGALLALGAGCSSQRAEGLSASQQEVLFSKVRPATGDTSRLLHNAHYYRLMGQPQLALKEMEEAHARNPDNLKVLDSLAHLYEDLGHFDRAQKLYQEGLSRHDANPALQNNLCFSYYLAGRWEQAEACFRKVLARDPGNVAARNNLGLLYCRMGKQEEARRLWREAEGEAAADRKVSQVLAALGVNPPTHYVQSPGRAPEPGPMVQTPAKTQRPSPGAAAQAAPQPTARLAKRPKAVTKPPGLPQAKAPQQVAAAPGPAAESAKKNNARPPVKTEPAAAMALQRSLKSSQVPLKPLSAAELEATTIEVRNGTRTRNLAHRTRSLLTQEGFNVIKIGNHMDFGAENTVIYYRPGAERVARSLRRDFFPTAKMEESSKLRGHAYIKLLLGHDLLDHPGLMARLFGGGEKL